MDEKKFAEVAAAAAAAAVKTALDAKDAAAQKAADARGTGSGRGDRGTAMETRLPADFQLVENVRSASTDLMFHAKTCLDIINPDGPQRDDYTPEYAAKWGPDDEGVRVAVLLVEAQELIETDIVAFLTALRHLRDYVQKIEEKPEDMQVYV